MKTTCKILVKNIQRGHHLGKLHKEEDNIKMSLEGTGYKGLNSSVSGYGIVEGPCEHNNEPLISRIDDEFLTTLSDCKLPYDHRHLLLTYRSKTLKGPVSISTIGQVTISNNSSGWYLGGTQF